MANPHRDFIRWAREHGLSAAPTYLVDSKPLTESIGEACDWVVELWDWADDRGDLASVFLTPLGADILASANAAGYDPDACEMCEGAGVLANFDGSGLHPAPSWDGPVKPRVRSDMFVDLGEAIWCECTRPASCKTCGGTKKVPVIGDFTNPCPDCAIMTFVDSVRAGWSPTGRTSVRQPAPLQNLPYTMDAETGRASASAPNTRNPCRDVGPTVERLRVLSQDVQVGDVIGQSGMKVEEVQRDGFAVYLHGATEHSSRCRYSTLQDEYVTVDRPFRAAEAPRQSTDGWARTPEEIDRVLHEALRTGAKIECEQACYRDVTIDSVTEHDLADSRVPWLLRGRCEAGQLTSLWFATEAIDAVRIVDAPAAEQPKHETLDEIEARLRSWVGREVQLVNKHTRKPEPGYEDVKGPLKSQSRDLDTVACCVSDGKWWVGAGCWPDFVLVDEDDLTLPSGRRFDINPPGAGED